MSRSIIVEQKTYDLSGLTLVSAGAIICVAGWFTGIGLLVGILLSIVGAFRMNDTGEKFHRIGYNAALLAVLAALTVVQIVTAAEHQTDTKGSVLIIFAYIAYAGYYWWRILAGCRDIASSKGNEALSRQCNYAWAGFGAVLVLILLFLLFDNTISFKLPIRIDQIGQSFSILPLILWVLLIISVITSAVVIRKVKNLYHGTPISTQKSMCESP